MMVPMKMAVIITPTKTKAVIIQMKIIARRGLKKAQTKIVVAKRTQTKKRMKTSQIMTTLTKRMTTAKVIGRKRKRERPKTNTKRLPSKTLCLRLETFYLIWTCCQTKLNLLTWGTATTLPSQTITVEVPHRWNLHQETTSHQAAVLEISESDNNKNKN